MELNELQQQRLAKLDRLRAAGIDPFPPRAHRTHTIAAALADFDGMIERGERMTLTGRIIGARRVMGKLAFAHITDESGKIQLWISKADLGDEWFARFRDELDTFDIVQATGTPRRTKTGEASLFVEELTVLAKALNPPPEKWHGLTDVEARLRERYLDLIVNDEVKQTFRTRAKIVTAMRRFLDDRGFIEVETPTLQPLYGGASAQPFVTHHNQLHQDLYLRISDELYLKRLIVGGFERVYEICKDFRNEGVDRTHNPEFTMMECYQAYADYNDIMRLVEDMFRYVALEVCGSTTIEFQGQTIDFGPDWQRVSIPEAIDEKTGIDIMRVTELEPLQAAIRAAGLRVELEAELGQAGRRAVQRICAAAADPADLYHRPPGAALAAGQEAARPAAADRALRADHRRHGIGQRLHRAERPDRPGAALSGAGPRLQRRRQRSSADGSRLHQRPDVRHAAHRRPGHRRRSHGHAAHQPADNPRGGAVSAPTTKRVASD